MNYSAAQLQKAINVGIELEGDDQAHDRFLVNLTSMLPQREFARLLMAGYTPAEAVSMISKTSSANRSSELRDCGTGAGGFQPGNSCAGGEGSEEIKDSVTSSKKEGAWLDKKNAPPKTLKYGTYSEELLTVADAKIFAMFQAKNLAEGATKSEAREYAIKALEYFASQNQTDAYTKIYASLGWKNLQKDAETLAQTLKNDPGIYVVEKGIANNSFGKLSATPADPPSKTESPVFQPPTPPPVNTAPLVKPISSPAPFDALINKNKEGATAIDILKRQNATVVSHIEPEKLEAQQNSFKLNLEKIQSEGHPTPVIGHMALGGKPVAMVQFPDGTVITEAHYRDSIQEHNCANPTQAIGLPELSAAKVTWTQDSDPGYKRYTVFGPRKDGEQLVLGTTDLDFALQSIDPSAATRVTPADHRRVGMQANKEFDAVLQAQPVKTLNEMEMSIARYAGAYSSEINGTLRREVNSPNEKPNSADLRVREDIAALDVLTRVSNEKERVLYRGKGPNSARQLDQLSVGDTFTDVAFGSWTADHTAARQFAEMKLPRESQMPVMMVVKTKLGAHLEAAVEKIKEVIGIKGGNSLDGSSNFSNPAANLQSESEYLMPRGIRYRIKSKRIATTGKSKYSHATNMPMLVIELEEIGIAA